MISEGSCDTEDWSNDAENSALIKGINYILNILNIWKIYANSHLNCKNILQYFLMYFWSNKCNLGEQKSPTTEFWTVQYLLFFIFLRLK